MCRTGGKSLKNDNTYFGFTYHKGYYKWEILKKENLKMEKNERKDPNVEYHLWSTEFMCIILLIFTLIIHLFFFLFLYRKSEAQEI